MRKIIILIILMNILCTNLFGQQEKKTTALNIEGQIAATTNTKAFFVNIGGPSLKLNLQKFSIGICMYPSLKFENEASKPLITPLLGLGPQLNFLHDKRFIILCPCYYNASKSVWTFSAGLGYILTKPKK